MKRDTAVKKNFDLAADFSLYVAKHPSIVKKVPARAKIVFMVSGNSAISAYNKKLGESVSRDEKRPVYKAVLEKRVWKIEPLTVAC
jgi:CRISPR/Cas system CMR-associated protein Cmr5 small subunit